MTELHELTGISQNNLSLMANGKSNGIQYNTLDKILLATNTTIDELLEQTGELYSLYVQREEEVNYEESSIFTYKIIGRKTSNEEFTFKFHFRVKHYSMGHRTVVHICYDKHEPGNNYDELFMKNLLQRRDSSTLEPLAYLVAYDLVHYLQIEGLSLNSLILFTWYGFVLGKDEEIHKIHLAPRDPNIVLEFNENCFDVLPNVKYLEDLPNIENVEYDFEIGKCSIDIYFT